jgi:pyruvate dehydrogenase E1 component alpha subunit
MMKKFDKKAYLKSYYDMLLWRKFEEKCAALYIQQKIRGFLHLYNGQEAILSGMINSIDVKKDKVITAYRCHVLPVAMGLHPKFVMAELLGKSTGSSRGKGGSMHMFSKEFNCYGGHGIVGGQIPLGAGIAFADKYNNKDAVTVCFMGDGAVRQGVLHETFNMAMNWNLPVIFVCENNGYAMGTSVERTANHTDIWKLGLAYEMPCSPVDGMKPEIVADAMDVAVQRARRGEGPTFLEIKTYRYKGHSMSDAQHYRTKEEVEDYKKIDPIMYVLDIIKTKKYASLKEIESINDKVKDLVKECIDFAESSPFPSPEDLFNDIYDGPYNFIRD